MYYGYESRTILYFLAPGVEGIEAKATCYPGLGNQINNNCGEYVKERVVAAPNLITSEGPGTTLPFAIEIIRQTKGDKVADDTAASMIITL